MLIIKHQLPLQQYLQKSGQKQQTIGFVPTMGALHQGHISLIKQSKLQAAITVCSIFVNPTQFNDPTDFEKYPVTIDADINLLEAAGCDVLFLPSVAEIYPAGLTAAKQYPLGFLETVLDGAYRPGHFQGVCQVVERLLEIVQPNLLFLGQKDYQQCMVITRLTQLMGIDTRVVIAPTQRETDGLAMSSRNRRLTPQHRLTAPLLYQTLMFLQQQVRPGDITQLKMKAVDSLTQAGFKVDYVEMANASTLQLIDNWDGTTPLVALVAAFIGEVRLIDNLVFANK
jgi:pantoate--beta-alanine ligase